MNAWEKIMQSHMSLFEDKGKDDSGSVPEEEAIPATHKRCSSCKEIKLRDDFYTRADHATRISTSMCRECHKTRSRDRYWINKARKCAKEENYERTTQTS